MKEVTWVEAVKLTLSRKRQHANYFDHYDKEVKERGVVQDLLELAAAKGGIHARSFALGNDPPDVLAYFEDGSEHAYEVVELVNQNAVEAQVKQSPEYGALVWTWNSARTCDAIRKIIKQKHRKCRAAFEGQPKIPLSLVIHTDEDQLDMETLRKYLGKFRPPKNKFEAIYLVVGYNPMHGGLGYLALK